MNPENTFLQHLHLMYNKPNLVTLFRREGLGLAKTMERKGKPGAVYYTKRIEELQQKLQKDGLLEYIASNPSPYLASR